MEENVLNGLMDDATFTKLQVLALYSQSISLPLSQLVCAPYHQSRNGLNLGEEFTCLLKHLEAIIKDPDISIGPNVSWTTATLDGKPWYNPEVIVIITRNQNHFPHLRPALITFFEGVLEVWRRFTSDVLNNPQLSAATPELRYAAFRCPANDLNEGALSLLRQTYRTFPRITFGQLNARLMCRFAWIGKCSGIQDTDYNARLNPNAIQQMSQMSPEAHQNLRKVSRERDVSQAHAKFRLAQAEEDIAEAKERRKAAEKSKGKAAERQQTLKAFTPILNLEQLRETCSDRLTAKQIQDQIKWHHRIGEDAHIPPRICRMKKAEAWIVMVWAVQRHLCGTSADEGM